MCYSKSNYSNIFLISFKFFFFSFNKRKYFDTYKNKFNAVILNIKHGHYANHRNPMSNENKYIPKYYSEVKLDVFKK